MPNLVDLPPEIQGIIWRLVCEERYTVDPDVEQMTTPLPAAAGIMKVLPYTVGPYYWRTLHLKMHQAARYNPDWDPEEEDEDEDDEKHDSDDEEHDSTHDGAHRDEEAAQNDTSAHNETSVHDEATADHIDPPHKDNPTHDETPAQHVDSAPHHANSPPSLHAGTWINLASATHFRTATISLNTGYRQGGPDGERAGAFGHITARFQRKKLKRRNKKTRIIRVLKLSGHCHVLDREDDYIEEYKGKGWKELASWERGVEMRMRGRGEGGCGLLFYGDCLWLLDRLEGALECLVQNGPESEDD